MKSSILTLILIMGLSILFDKVDAQAPNYFNYQAVIRDASGEILSNQEISIIITILEGSTNGNSVYKETHSVSTNSYGIVSIKIGSGNNKIGDIASINWGDNDFFIKTELDIAGGSDYKEISTAQLMSVPYALYAKTAESTENATLSGDNPVFSGWDKDVSDDFSGDYNELSNKPAIPEPINGSETAFDGWDKNTSDDFSGNYNDLTNKPIIPKPVDGEESAFNGWDKNASDDFSGNYNDLENKPEIKDESGVNWVESSSAIKIQETASQLNSLQINAPSSGYVIVTASGFVNWLIKTTGEGKVTLKISNISDDITQPVQAIGVYGLSTSWYRRYPFSITRVFSVSAGENTFYLNGLLENDDGSAWVHNHTFVGVFVPSNY